MVDINKIKENDNVLIPILGNGIYKVDSILNDEIIVKYTRDLKITIKPNQIYRIVKWNG